MGLGRLRTVALCLVLATGACTPSSPAPTEPPTSTAPVATPTPERVPSTAAEVWELNQAMSGGWPAMHLFRDNADVDVDGATWEPRRWTWRPDPQAADRRLALLAAPEGRSFVVYSDGSVATALEGGGVGWGCLAFAPLAPGTYELLAPDLLELHARADAPSEAVDLWLGITAVESATWGEAEGGRSLAVVPTEWGRGAGLAAAEIAWDQVQLLASTGGEEAPAHLRDQLICHALGAPDKETWNLEPWRPDVGLPATLLAQCNPT